MQLTKPMPQDNTLARAAMKPSKRKEPGKQFHLTQTGASVALLDGTPNPILVVTQILNRNDQGEVTEQEAKSLEHCREILKKNEAGFREFMAPCTRLRQGALPSNHSTFARYAFGNWSFRPTPLNELANAPVDLAKIRVPRGEVGGAQ